VQRQQADAGLAALEPAAHAERSLREDPHHAVLLERPQGPPQGADVRPLQVQQDGAELPVQQRVQGRRPPHAGHDEKRDRSRQRHGQHHAVEVVVVVGGDDVRTALGQMLEPLDSQVEPPLQHRSHRPAQGLIDEGKARSGGGRAGCAGQSRRARHVAGSYSMRVHAPATSPEPDPRDGTIVRGRRTAENAA
jgi:hypothetical protein